MTAASLNNSPAAWSSLTQTGRQLAQWRHWPRERRDTLFVLAVIGWTILPHVDHLAWWCSAITALILLWRAHLALHDGPLPGRWPVLAVMLLATGLTWWHERTLLGREAGVTMLVVLMGLKTLELRARRDALVVFFLGFFLALMQCLYSQSLLTALGMLVSSWGLLTAQVLSNMPVAKPTLWRAGAIAARSALLGLPLMVVLFVLFPRFGPLWGLPQDAMGRTGLSGTLRMGGVAELANDESIAFRVRFDGAKVTPPAEALYFRGPVLTHFDGLEWFPSLAGAIGPRRGRPQPPELRLLGAPLRYELLLEPIRLPLLPLLEATTERGGGDEGPDTLASQLPDWGLWQGNDLQWHTDRIVGERLRIRTQAWLRFELGPDRASAALGEDLALPIGFNPRTIAWAQQTRQSLPDADARTLVGAVLATIRQSPFVYTLQPGDYSGRDAIDDFWLARRQGFCEHFATAFVVVMRAMGVPARVVTGYQGAAPVDDDGWRVVRQSDAHAWAEYWQPGNGWIRADPTAAVAPDRVRNGRTLTAPRGLMAGALNRVSPEMALRLRLAWELLDNRWNQWVMGYSRASQFRLLQSLGVPQPDWTDVARLLVGLLSSVAVAGAAWAWWDRRRQDPWQRLHGRVVARLQRAGIPALLHHGPRSLATLLRLHRGAGADGAALALEALDSLRYAAGGQPLPGRRWWPEFLRLTQGSLNLPAPAADPGRAARSG